MNKKQNIEENVVLLEPFQIIDQYLALSRLGVT